MLFEMVRGAQVIHTGLTAMTLDFPVHSCLGTQKIP